MSHKITFKDLCLNQESASKHTQILVVVSAFVADYKFRTNWLTMEQNGFEYREIRFWFYLEISCIWHDHF